MLIKTLLNSVEKIKSFVYVNAQFIKVNGNNSIVLDVSRQLSLPVGDNLVCRFKACRIS